MNKRDQIRQARATARQKQNGSMRWRTYLLMLVCGLTLVSGFFLAARQHFSSMDFGMKNSRLRKQIGELEAEKRRLLLAREVSLSPAEIKKAVKKAGLLTTAGVEGEVAQVVSSTKEKALPTAVSNVKSMIVKTAAVSPVLTTSAMSYAKTVKLVKPAKTTMAAE